MATECIVESSTAGPSTAANKRGYQYQHFIPQFLLKNFSHKYVIPDNNSHAGRGGRRDRRRKIYPGEQVVNSLALAETDEFFIEECPIRRTCGLENMYEDSGNLPQDQGHLEKKFAALERRASVIYRKIINAYKDGQSDVWLTRTEKDILRKFMFLLTLRSEQYHRKFNINSVQDYNEDDKEWLQDYMEAYNIAKPIDVWLQSLETIIDLEIDPEGHWKEYIKHSIYYPIADMFIDHIGELYMSICTPENHVEDFVLTDNCCNVTEGRTPDYFDVSANQHIDLNPCFHKFAPISPKLMIVLRSNLLPEPLEDLHPAAQIWQHIQKQMWIDTRYGDGTKSILEDIPIRKAKSIFVEEVNGVLVPRSGWNQKPGKHDKYCFTIFKIPTRHVRIINGLLIDYAFRGSTIIFFRKKVFLDLMEWFLSEPCQVGKKLTEKHAAQQLTYIKGLSQFMQREGREVISIWKFWPSENRDLQQFHIQNIAGTQFLEDQRRGKDGTGLDCETIYEKLGGTNQTFNQDMAAATIMFQTWTRSVDSDYSSPEYESIRSNKLRRLLGSYQGQHSARFWLFLKRMRLAQIKPSRALGSIRDIALFVKEECQGFEDLFAYAHPIMPKQDINVAMYKAFNQSIVRLRGPEQGLETMGHFSLFGDEKWRIPNPSSGRNQPYEDDEVKNKAQEKQPARPLSQGNADGNASTESIGQKQQLEENEKSDNKKTAGSSHTGIRKRRAQKGVVEPTEPSVDDKAKDEAGINETGCTAVYETDKPACSSSRENKEKRQSSDPKDQSEVNNDATREAKADTQNQKSFWHFLGWSGKKSAETIARNKKTYDELKTSWVMIFFGTGSFIVLGASLFFFALGALGYALSHLSYGLVWVVNALAWVLDMLASALDVVAWAMNWLADASFPVAWGLYKAGWFMFAVVFCVVKMRATL
ncbi:hypothetical protein V8C42DRAFT_331170 [Trichoderma barbatum]